MISKFILSIFLILCLCKSYKFDNLIQNKANIKEF